MKWTVETIIEANATLPPVPDNHAKWLEVWVRELEEFDLTYRFPRPYIPFKCWNEELWARCELKQVRVSNIKHSANVEGIRIDVLAWYLQDPIAETENFDTDGWLGNDHPILIKTPDGNYTIRDGNHRIVTKMLQGAEFVQAYVMEGT